MVQPLRQGVNERPRREGEPAAAKHANVLVAAHGNCRPQTMTRKKEQSLISFAATVATIATHCTYYVHHPAPLATEVAGLGRPRAPRASPAELRPFPGSPGLGDPPHIDPQHRVRCNLANLGLAS